MGRAYERLARPVLFRLAGGDAEGAHEWTLRRLAALSRRPLALAALRRWYAVDAPREVFGLRFPNPVGLAAGMDKNGVALPAWPAIGLGFVEVGTVTRHAQPGNERPRVFRLRRSRAVINRMGFNNDGAAALAHRLAALADAASALADAASAEKRASAVADAASAETSASAGRFLPVPLGISLGKSKVTPLADAVEDYLASFRALHRYGDYFAVNVSSPNTPGLRDLQDRAHLGELLAALSAQNASFAAPKPILVKIAPDLTEPAIEQALQACLDHGVAGIIATNTTLARTGLDPADVVRGGQAGGLSGAPLTARTREVVAFVHRHTAGALPVIGVGGILDPDDAVALMDAGASLVQLYTGLIYRGPALVRATALALSRRSGAGSPGVGLPGVRSPKIGSSKIGSPCVESPPVRQPSDVDHEVKRA
jgi:dihydroorotate dehydrogenase